MIDSDLARFVRTLVDLHTDACAFFGMSFYSISVKKKKKSSMFLTFKQREEANYDVL